MGIYGRPRYHGPVTRRSTLLSLFGAGALLASMPVRVLGNQRDLGGAKTVYLIPMSGGLDQYLANKITESGLLQVVADPALADAIITDRLGESFEKKMAELYPPPDADEDEEKDKDDRSQGRVSSFRSGRGNVFLVERASKRVVWSTYLRPRNSSPDEMSRTADHIVKRLEKLKKGK